MAYWREGRSYKDAGRPHPDIIITFSVLALLEMEVPSQLAKSGKVVIFPFSESGKVKYGRVTHAHSPLANLVPSSLFLRTLAYRRDVL